MSASMRSLEIAMNSPLFKLLLAGALAAAPISCGSDVACGPGTFFDKAKNQCLPTKPPDLNVIVEDFDLGEFEFTSVDVPEQMEVGNPETRRFTVRNKGEKARGVVSIRYGIVAVNERIEELRERLAALDDDTAIEPIYLGGVILEDLESDEARTIDYRLSLPNDVEEGLYGFFFSIDEVPLLKNTATGEYLPDFDNMNTSDLNGKSYLTRAALVFAPATMIVGKPDRANLRVLLATLDNASFELDDSERQEVPMFTLTMRMSSQAMHITETVTARAHLKLPGHVVQTPGKDLGMPWFEVRDLDFDAAPDESTFAYDANRTLSLLIRSKDGLVPSRSYDPICRSFETVDRSTGERREETSCAVIFNEEGVDDLFQLHLSSEDSWLLGQTRRLAAQNPGLNQHGELAGELVFTLETPQLEYRDNKADNQRELAVVFLMPDIEEDSSDEDEEGNSGDTWVTLGEKSHSSAHRPPNNGYARYVETLHRVSRKSNSIVKGEHRVTSIDSMWLLATGWVMQSDVKFRWDTTKDVTDPLHWNGSVYLARTLTNLGSMSTYSEVLVDAPFAPTCDTANTDAGVVSRCRPGTHNQFSLGAGAMPSPVPSTQTFANLVRRGSRLSPDFNVGQWWYNLYQGDWTRSQTIDWAAGWAYDTRTSAKLYSFKVDAKVTSELGVALVGTVLDKSPTYKMKEWLGGTVNLGRFDQRLNVTLRSISDYDSQAGCWKQSGLNLMFDVPYSDRGPSGSARHTAYTWEEFAYSFIKYDEKEAVTLFVFYTGTPSVTGSSLSKGQQWVSRFAGEQLAGMCADAVPGFMQTWQSAKAPGGMYSNSSSSNLSLNKQFWSPSRVKMHQRFTYDTQDLCVQITVRGKTQATYDQVVLYDRFENVIKTGNSCDATGTCTPVYENWSGDIDRTTTQCNNGPWTVALETDSATVNTGVSVAFRPVDLWAGTSCSSTGAAPLATWALLGLGLVLRRRTTRKRTG
jgi:uncharacterized protein (TIGR03382 family)